MKTDIYFKRYIKRSDTLLMKEIYFDPNGSKHWFLNGNYHRVDGPAIEYWDGTKYWYLNGNLHREDGPAYIGSNGSKQWWLNGEPYS